MIYVDALEHVIMLYFCKLITKISIGRYLHTNILDISLLVSTEQNYYLLSNSHLFFRASRHNTFLLSRRATRG